MELGKDDRAKCICILKWKQRLQKGETRNTWRQRRGGKNNWKEMVQDPVSSKDEKS